MRVGEKENANQTTRERYTECRFTGEITPEPIFVIV